MKIQKLKQNLKNEVVWVFKDNSFVNLVYFLSAENTNNDTFKSLNTNNIKSRNSKDVIANNNTYNKNIIDDNTCLKKEESNNLDTIDGRITKKIIRRRNPSMVLNGGIDNNKNNIINSYNSKNNCINQTYFNSGKTQIINTKNVLFKNMDKSLLNKCQKIQNIYNPETEKNILLKKKQNSIIKNKNLSNSLCLNETSRNNNLKVDNLTMQKIHVNFSNLNNSFLNNSDFQNINSNRREKQNSILNTLDSIDIRENNDEFKILFNNNNITESSNIYSKKYLHTIKPTDYEYDTFCQAIIKTGLSEEKMSLSNFSENFPAQCGHELCSKLPALEPRVLDCYQNCHKKKKLDIKQDLTSHLVFPLGIKLCVEQNFQNDILESEPLINTIYNEKGDLYYIASLTIYKKITIKNYNKIYSINPIDTYNKIIKEQNIKNGNINLQNNIIKTFNRNNNMKINNIDDNNNINNPNLNFQEEKLKYNENDFIYIPECISLISRYPFFNQLSICLKAIINMRRQIINGDNDQKIENEISNFINYIINQIPIPNNKYNILFYTPISIEPVILYNPFLYNFGNFTCQNIFSILNIDNIITIFLLILLEQKIIFVDINHLKLSAVTFFFLNLIYPLTWVNTYQPLLSLSTVKFTQSITPFIMGGNENLILYAYYKKYIIYNELYDNIDKSNITFVSLTNNLISCDCYNLIVNKIGQNKKQILNYLNLPDLPKSIEKKLVNHLNDIEKIENLSEINNKIRAFFCRIMILILDDYKDYIVNSLEKHVFNKDNYLMNKKDDRKLFYKELTGTQLFTQFIYNENQNYKMKKINLKSFKRKNETYGELHDENYKDYSFFINNKNKLEEIKIMLKEKRKVKIKNSIKTAKKIIKNIGQLFHGINEDKRSEISLSTKKGLRKNLSLFKPKNKKKKVNIYNIILMPYFIQEPDINLTDSEKYDYIQNKLNSIITLDNQLSQINNYKNKYIFDFNQKFDLKLVKDDKTRYFIGTLNHEEENDIDNISKLNLNSNNKSKFKINGNKTSKNIITEFSTKERKSEEINFTKIKEKINSWYINIYLISNKRKTITVINLNECFNAVKSRKFFSKLISQNYRTLFDIKENNQTFLGNEGFMEILEKIQFILSKLTYEEYETGKLLTLGCFKYYTFLEENKCSKYYLYNKYTELFSPCELWLNHIFWKTWFDEDISYIEKELNSTNSIDYSLELNSSSDKENELYEYQEENNNLSIEFRLLGKIFKIMTHLKLSDKFINKVIYDDLAENYLTEKELNSFKEDMA